MKKEFLINGSQHIENTLLTLFRNSAFQFVSQYTSVNALKAPENAKIVNPDNVLLSQFNGLGQVVEFERVENDRTVKVALCNVAQDTWVPVFFFDTVPAKDK